MKLLHLTLFISGCILCIDSQLQSGNNQQPVTINPERIYFSDNRPSVGSVKTKVDIQKSDESQKIRQDSYSQALFGIRNNGAQVRPANFDGNLPSGAQQPSQDIQPPKRSNQNYYNAYAEYAGDAPLPLPTTSNFVNISFAVSNFGLKILKNMNHREGNLVISPFSIAELLALLQQGALGETQQQISDALNMTPQTSLESFKKVNDNFQISNSRNILRVANNLYVADAFELSPAFKSVAMRSFGSEVTPMKFSGAHEAVQKINAWVAQKTSNKITELLTDDAVNENTQVLMVNAVYFKGLWAIRFRPESTLPREFHVNDVARKTVPFMRIRKIFRAGTDPSSKAQIVVLPFEDNQYSLMVIVPSVVSRVGALVDSLTSQQLASYLNFEPAEVDLEIPKFTARADTDLNQVFKEIGITNVFGQKSELSGLGTFRTYSPQLSSALHTATLSIDEDGGTGAAATSFAVVALSYDEPSAVIKVNRPFVTVLWDSASALPLFMAVIQDPTS